MTYDMERDLGTRPVMPTRLLTGKERDAAIADLAAQQKKESNERNAMKAELYEHMQDCAKAAGFASITHAILTAQKINSPEVTDFIEGMKIEAAHQRERWGEAHDRSKSADNWFWLVGYLAGKALRSAILGNMDLAKHHTISAAATLYQWHCAISRDDSGCGRGEDADLEAKAVS